MYDTTVVLDSAQILRELAKDIPTERRKFGQRDREILGTVTVWVDVPLDDLGG